MITKTLAELQEPDEASLIAAGSSFWLTPKTHGSPTMTPGMSPLTGRATGLWGPGTWMQARAGSRTAGQSATKRR